MSQPAHRVAILGTGYTPSLDGTAPREISAVAAAGFEPVLIEPRLSAFPDTPAGRMIMALGNVEAGISAEKSGFSGIYINTFGDYGLAELRSALNIPVMGAGEAAMSLSTLFGQRFSIVTIWPRSLDFIYRERIAACGMERRCVSVRYVLDEAEIAETGRGAEDDPVKRMREGAEGVIGRIVATAQRAVAEDHAQVIVLGCTCMGPIADKIAARLDVPVIDALTAGYKALETMLSLRLKHGRSAYPKASPAILDALETLALGNGAGGIVPDDCEVCAVTAEAAQ